MRFAVTRISHCQEFNYAPLSRLACSLVDGLVRSGERPAHLPNRSNRHRQRKRLPHQRQLRLLPKKSASPVPRKTRKLPRKLPSVPKRRWRLMNWQPVLLIASVSSARKKMRLPRAAFPSPYHAHPMRHWYAGRKPAKSKASMLPLRLLLQPARLLFMARYTGVIRGRAGH